MSGPRGPEKLRKFRKRHNIGPTAAGEALGVTHAAVLAWEKKKASPTEKHRRAIRIWTGGEVDESDWVSREERERTERLAQVRPFDPAKGAA